MSLLAQAAPIVEPGSSTRVILVTIAGVALLLLLVIRGKWQAFLALLFTSFAVGIAAGMPATQLLDSVQRGMASTLGFIAIVVGLGAMLGQILEISGGAERLAQGLIGGFGEKRAQWALAITGFIVSIPVFFDVALVILIPIIYGLSRKANRSLLYYGIPLMAGGVVTHAFVPPTPGPAAVAQILNADMGWVILIGAMAGVPATIVAGPWFGTWIARRIFAREPSYVLDAAREAVEKMDAPGSPSETRPAGGPAVPAGGVLKYAGPELRALPSFAVVNLLVFLPLVLIVSSTLANTYMQPGDVRNWLYFLGHPFVALLLVTLLAFFLLGTRRGYTRDQLQEIATKALEPAGIIILITGAGGVFKQVLIDSGVGLRLGEMMAGSQMSPLVLAYLIAAFVRVAQGSATVAMTTAAGIMAPLLATLEIPEEVRDRELAFVTIAIAAGSTIFSHVNDSGFWLVNRFFGMSVKDTLKSWSVMTTIVSVVGFLSVWLLSMLF
jgi:Gnt-I system low-affinity gluconate transporter